MIRIKLPFEKIAIALIIVLSGNVVQAQLTVSGAMNPTQLVQNVLIGAGVTVSNVTYSGNAAARGSFNGTSSNIGFAGGLILTTGDITNAVGPNDNTGASSNHGTTSVDPQLTGIASGSVHDAAILSFDFVPLSDTIKFRYVFGSEEYMEFVGQGFNDVFGFFISGQNPAGGNYVNKNIALIPGTVTPVSIDNVNLNVNGAFYFDNGDGSGSGTAPDGQTVQYDGFTKPLTAQAAVVCGQTYHIKIAIGDVFDGSIDSGVFLEAGSFTSHGVNIVPQISYGGPNDSVLYEGCGTACIYFVRTSNIANADTVNLTLSGTATNGTDYYTGAVPGTLFPSQIYFAPGVDSIQVCLTAPADGTAEGLESISLLVQPVGSGLCIPPPTTATIYINEHQPLALTTSNDTTICFGSTAVLHAIASGGVPPYTYTWSNGLAAVASPNASPNTSTTYTVSLNDACTGAPDPTPAVTDSIKVSVTHLPHVNIFHSITYGGVNNSTLYEGCGQACINFVRTSNLTFIDTVNMNISGLAQNGIDYYFGVAGILLPNQLIFPVGVDTITRCINAVADGLAEGIEKINLSISGSNLCGQTLTKDSLPINEFAPLSISTTGDTTVCNNGYALTLHVVASGGVVPYTYTWSGGAAATANPVVTPNTTTNYIVTVNDACTGSPDPTPAKTDSVKVTVLPFHTVAVTMYPHVDNVGPNDSALFEGCGSACVDFVRSSSLTYLDTLTVVIAGTATNVTDYYYGTAGTAFPTQLIFPIGVDTVRRCINAIADGLTEGTEHVNLSILQGNPCLQSNTATIDIKDIPPMTIHTGNDTTLCNLGGTVTLHAIVSGGLPPYSYTWTGGAAAVANPVVNVTTTTSFIVLVNDVCAGTPDPSPAVIDTTVVKVLVFSPLVLNAGGDITVCKGETVNIRPVQTGGGSPFVYSWTTLSGSDILSSTTTLSTSLLAGSSDIYQVSVVDVCANTQSDQITVTVEPSCGLSIPNIITPDGHGASVNETFYIENLDKFPGSSLSVYNRWGKKMYENANYLNDWNPGKYADGTYYYVLMVPKFGQTMPTLKKGTESDIKVTTTENSKTFAGYFQVSRVK